MTRVTMPADDMIAYDVEAHEADERDVYAVVRQRVHVNPYTPADRELAARRRGRCGFSYGASVCILPSARFYRPGEAARLLEVAAREAEYIND